MNNAPKKLQISNNTLEYTLRKSARAKRIRIQIEKDGTVCLVVPNNVRQSIAEDFLRQKSTWVLKKIAYIHNRRTGEVYRYNKKDYIRHKESARTLIHERLEYFNQYYGFTYRKVNIRDQKTRWGSCSSKRNLNFSYKLIFLAPKIRDYIIVHELCHLKEMNHSPRFWRLVEQMVPDHTSIRKQLREAEIHLS